MRPSDRHVRVSLDGELIAETRRAMALFETGLPTRWYMPREDVSARLQPSATTTYCPYKGTAGVLLDRAGGGQARHRSHLVLRRALGGNVTRVRDLLCFFNEKVDIELDGELQPRPESPWSNGVKSDPQNAAPAVTRGWHVPPAAVAGLRARGR